MRTIGLIGGMSWQSSRLYYDRINQMVAERLGGAHSAKIILNSMDFAPLAKLQAEGDWRRAGAMLADMAQALERAGADVIAIGANTMHKVANQVTASVQCPPAPYRRCTGEGTTQRCTLASPPSRHALHNGGHVPLGYLENKGIGCVTPYKDERDALHAIIYDQLIRGIVTDEARQTVQAMIDRSGTQEADSVIFACTEIGMLFPPTEIGLPGYDTLELHAQALVDFALA